MTVYSQVDILALRYKSVNFRAAGRPFSGMSGRPQSRRDAIPGPRPTESGANTCVTEMDQKSPPDNSWMMSKVCIHLGAILQFNCFKYRDEYRKSFRWTPCKRECVHTVQYDHFITSQLASRDCLEGLVWCSHVQITP